MVTPKFKPHYETQAVTCTWMIGRKKKVGKKKKKKTQPIPEATRWRQKKWWLSMAWRLAIVALASSPPPFLSVNYAGQMSLLVPPSHVVQPLDI